MWDMLRKGLEEQDTWLIAKAFVQIASHYGSGTIEHLKLFDGLPSPVSHEFEAYPAKLGLLVQGMVEAGTDLHPDIDTRLAIFRDLARFQVDSLGVYLWRASISETLEESGFWSFCPMKQLQLLCTFFEDQARLSEAKLQEHQLQNEDTPLILAGQQTETGTYATHWQGGQANGDGLDLNIRYLLFKNQGRSFGNHVETGINPYNLQPVKVLTILPQLLGALTTFWGYHLFRDWRIEHGNQNQTAISFLPPSLEEYVLEDVSLYRAELQWEEWLEAAGEAGIYDPQETVNTVWKLAATVIYPADVWIKRLKGRDLRDPLRKRLPYDALVEEVLQRLFEPDAATISVGKGSARVTLADLILGMKFLWLISASYKSRIWRDFREQEGKFEVLCPVFPAEDLAKLLSETGLIPSDKARRVINLLTFDRHRKHLEIWHQPLIPLNDRMLMLLPSVATSLNPQFFIESHLLEAKYDFGKRGPKYEQAIRTALGNAGVLVAPQSFTFAGSDGLDCEVDILAVVGDWLLVGDAKCIKFPADPAQRRNAWSAISYGVEQVERRCRLLQTDWDKVRAKARIPLTETPPPPEKVLPIVATNIPMFSGRKQGTVLICDVPTLLRYFQEGLPSKQRSQHIVSEGIRRVRKGPIDIRELIDYLSAPPQIRKLQKQFRAEPQLFPPLTRNCPPLMYPNVASLVSGHAPNSCKQEPTGAPPQSL